MKARLKFIALLSFGALCFFTANPAQAAFSPLSLNIIPPVEFPPANFNVTGARLSLLWGHQRSMYGVDVGGFGNITDQTFVGASLSGLFNITHGDTYILGLQFAGLFNNNTSKTVVSGAQLAVGANVQTAESSVSGIQLAGLVNYAPHTDIHGAQIGLYNVAQDVYGVQIGLVNHCSNLHGLQIGLVNFNDRGLFSVSPFLNVGF